MADMNFRTVFLDENVTALTTVTMPSSNEDYDKIKEILNEWGFVVVTGVITQTECNNATQMFYDDLINLINYDAITDNNLKNLYEKIKEAKSKFPQASIPGLVDKGFMSMHTFPHSKFSWNLRSNNNVRNIYAHLHDVQSDELCVSTDVAFFTPDDTSNKPVPVWCHGDQNIFYKAGSSKSYQGILYVWDSSVDNTSTTVVIPKSHLNEYYELLHNIPNVEVNQSHSINLRNVVDKDFVTSFVEKWKQLSRTIRVPQGSLLLFDSKIIHQGYKDGPRLAQPLCWEPKMYRTEEAYRRKIHACMLGCATTHWASLGIHHAVSFLKLNKTQFYSKHLHQCIFPLRDIPNYSISFDSPDVNPKTVNIKKLSTKEIEQYVKPEYLEML
jgi:hypothetical protein